MEQLIKVEGKNIIVAEEYLQDYAKYLQIKKTMEEKEATFKKELTKAMEDNCISSYENDLMKVSLIIGGTRETLDSKKLKEELPNVYEKYTRTSDVASSIRIKIKA